MADKPKIPDFPNLPDFGQMITQACEVVASVRGIPYDFNGTLSLENKFVVLFKTVKEMFEAQDNLVKSYRALYDFVNQYFANLDLQEEVNKKITEMVEDGSLTDIIRKYIDPLIDTQDRKITVLENRMDTFSSLPPGSTSGDAELIDIRVPADGFNSNKPYPNAGDAVRGQVETLKDNIDKHTLRVNDGYYNIESTPFNGTRNLNNISGSKCLMCDTSKDIEVNKQNNTPPFTQQMLKDSIIMTLLNITPELDDDGTFQLGYLRGLTEEKAPYLYYRTRRTNTTDNFDRWSPWALISDPRTAFTSNNIQYNNTYPPTFNNLNNYTENKAYEFDIDFTSEEVANAPFYPFKGTLLCFNPNNYDLQQNEINYTTVGLVQLVFRSRNVFDYKPELYFRCAMSGPVGKEIWSPWAKLTPEQPNTNINLTPIECIEDFCVVGDSMSAGYTNIGGITITSEQGVARKANWVSYMELNTGRTVENLAVGGSTTQTWRDSLLTKLKKHECYIVYLGGNDISSNTEIGASSDIMADYNNNKNSYYGNYDYIVRYIHNYNPKATIFCISNTWWDCSNNKYIEYNKAIKYICNLYKYTSYIDITTFATSDNKILAPNFNGHFSPLGYSVYGKYIQKAINDYMLNNPSKFLAIPYSLA